ncbi:MAG TPA: polysaccharide biosynthesis tyrosine autokinase [Caulobacterales bacterium]|nr:polysaccharide biosynthesis tyrosine autokinase [Caulobacterales bacterium]
MSVLSQDQPAASSSQHGAPVGLADIFGITAALNMVKRRFWLMGLVGVVAGSLALAHFLSQPKTYQATALVVINPRQERVLGSEDAVISQLPRESSAIDSEIELLRSPALIGQLVDALGMTHSADGQPQTPAEQHAREQLANSLAGSLNVRRRGMTYVIEISATSSDAQRAQLIANTYADVYIASQVNVRVDTAQRANSWLTRRLAELRQDVEQKESAAEAFRSQSGLISASGSSLVEQQITNVQTQVLQAQADLAEKQARYQQLQQLQASGSSVDTIGNALNSETIRGLREREADIARRQSDLESRYLPTHPAVQSVRSERADIERQIQDEVDRISTNLANEVSVARARLATLQGSLNTVRTDLAANSEASIRLRELEREATASRQVYEAYLQRYQQIADQDQLNTADARIMAYAHRPGAPSSPNLKIALALSVALGLFLGIAAGVAAEILDQSVKSADELESKLGYPCIASIPTIRKSMMRLMPPAERHPAGYLVGRPMSAFTEALRVLRTVIVYSKLDFSVKVVAITSALPDEGKTTISVCLGRVAAMSGQKVVVVDCDLRKQSINDVIDIETDTGILQVLAGEAPWRAAIVRDPSSECDILPVATSGFTPRDVFGSEAMTRLVNDLRGHYDLVILDCAPILAVAETRVIVKHADTTVVVARAGKSAVGAVRSAISQTETAGGKVLGVALNCVLPHWQSYADSLYFYQSKSYYSVS